MAKQCKRVCMKRPSVRRPKMHGGKSIAKRLGIRKWLRQAGRRKDVKMLGRKLSSKLIKKADRLIRRL